MTAPISNGPTTHGYTTMRDATPVDDDPLDTRTILSRIESVVRPAPRGGSEEPLRFPVAQRSHRQRESLGDFSDRVENGVVAHGIDSGP